MHIEYWENNVFMKFSTTKISTAISGALFAFLFMTGIINPATVFARGPAKPDSEVPAAREMISSAWKALDEELNIENIDKALIYLENALKLDPNNADLLGELSQEYFMRAEQMTEQTPKDKKARESWYKKGSAAAETSLAVKETAAGHYWYAANLAASVKNRSVFLQLKAFPAIRANMLWVERNEKDYRYGAFAFFWARVVSQAPKGAAGSVGMDPDQVIQEMDDAMKVEPRFIQNYLYMAMFYYQRGEQQKALEILDLGIKIEPESLPQEKAHNRYALRISKETWKKWTGKDYPDR